jgi:multidrug efflux pump subunit AcrA (membrane-fusion protein)
MSGRGRRVRWLAAALLGIVAVATASVIAAQSIRSPAQVAADTGPPKPSLITAPVERRLLSTEVIGRGIVRYGAPQAVVLPTSALKTGSQLVSRVPRPGDRIREGDLAMSVSGRPVLVLRGDLPAHRDLHPGMDGADVAQLKRALHRMGFLSGPLDSHYDAAAGAAIAAWYRKAGWTPFGATDVQADQLRTASAAAASASAALLQAQLTARITNPSDVNKAATDTIASAETINTASLAVATALTKLGTARDAAVRAGDAERRARIVGGRDAAVAQADMVTKSATLANAGDAQAEAQRRLDAAPPDMPPSDRESLRAALRKATNDVAVARAEVDASQAGLAAAQAAAANAVTQAQADARQAARDVSLATAELERARGSLRNARAGGVQAQRHLAVLKAPAATAVQRGIVAAAEAEVRRTSAEVARIATLASIQVPADEILFFPVLPLRVDAVNLKPGDPLSGKVMTVTNSRLAIDSSLAANDAALVRPGQAVTIEQPDLGIKITGTVTRVADRPGTNGVSDPSRVYLEVTPQNAPPVLVGSSVKLAIAVKTTKGSVLAVPLSALSVAADGTSRVQVDRGGGVTRFVTVEPGLAAQGFAEVRPVGAPLNAGDLVVVGTRGSTVATTPPAAPTGAGAAVPGGTTAQAPSGATSPPPSGTTSPGTPTARNGP